MTSHRSPHPGYQRHQSEQTALYAIVEQRLPKLCAGLSEQDASLPAFVTREFRDYLRCGLLEYGFIRVKCNGCRHEHSVAFSCKRRRLTRDGWLVLDSEQPWLDLEPADAIDSLTAASIRYHIALGAEVGRRTMTLKNPHLTRSDTAPKALTADQNGFSLNAAVACQPHERDRLERLCRYITPVRGRGPPSASSGLPCCSVGFPPCRLLWIGGTRR